MKNILIGTKVLVLALAYSPLSVAQVSKMPKNVEIKKIQEKVNFEKISKDIKEKTTALKTSSVAKGGVNGGGGNAVVFYKDKQKKFVQRFELFDYWEQNYLFSEPYKLDLSSPTLSVSEKIDYVLNRLEKYDPYRAYHYKQLAKKILSNFDKYLLVDAEFGESNDDNSPIKPLVENSDKVRIAVNFANGPSSNKPFLFSKFLFNHPKMTNDVRAGSILHEIEYNFEPRPISADQIRRYNYIISSDALNGQMSQEEYIVEAEKLSLHFAESVRVKINNCDKPVIVSYIWRGISFWKNGDDNFSHSSHEERKRDCPVQNGSFECSLPVSYGVVLVPADLSECNLGFIPAQHHIFLDAFGNILKIKPPDSF